MDNEKPLVNKVAASGLITINLEEYFPEGEIVSFDLKDYLFMELILKEKDFRAAMKAYDWSGLEGKNVAVFCSADAIVPVWAYMLVAVNAAPFVKRIHFGDAEQMLINIYQEAIQAIDAKQYEGRRIVIKGCSHKPVPVAAYLELTSVLQPFAQSIMYGEPCSTVPIFKRPRIRNTNKQAEKTAD